MLDTDGKEILGFANGLPVYEEFGFEVYQRATAHDPHSGQFTSGSGGSGGKNSLMAKAAGKASDHYFKKTGKTTDSDRREAYKASTLAYAASKKAHESGNSADHKAAHEAHGKARALHDAIAKSSKHSSSVKGHHGRESAGHGLAMSSHG